MWFVLLYYHIFFYSQVDHGFDTVYADDDNSDSDRVPGTDPEEESTDGGIHQLSICQLEPGGKDMMQSCYDSDVQSEKSDNNSIASVYADDDNSDPDYVPGTDPHREKSTYGDIDQLTSVCQLEPSGKDIMMQSCYDSDVQSEISEIIPNMNVTVQQPCTSGNLRNIRVLKHNNIGKKRKWDKKHSCSY